MLTEAILFQLIYHCLLPLHQINLKTILRQFWNTFWVLCGCGNNPPSTLTTYGLLNKADCAMGLFSWFGNKRQLSESLLSWVKKTIFYKKRFYHKMLFFRWFLRRDPKAKTCPHQYWIHRTYYWVIMWQKMIT